MTMRPFTPSEAWLDEGYETFLAIRLKNGAYRIYVDPDHVKQNGMFSSRVLSHDPVIATELLNVKTQILAALRKRDKSRGN